MANIIGIPLMVLVVLSISVLAAATVNDGACAAVAAHPTVIRAIEQFLMLCWLV